jgi:hypothetical protein
MYSANAHCVVGSVAHLHPSLFSAFQTGIEFCAVSPSRQFVRQRLTYAVDLVIVAGIGLFPERAPRQERHFVHIDW